MVHKGWVTQLALLLTIVIILLRWPISWKYNFMTVKMHHYCADLKMDASFFNIEIMIKVVPYFKKKPLFRKYLTFGCELTMNIKLFSTWFPSHGPLGNNLQLWTLFRKVELVEQRIIPTVKATITKVVSVHNESQLSIYVITSLQSIKSSPEIGLCIKYIKKWLLLVNLFGCLIGPLLLNKTPFECAGFKSPWVQVFFVFWKVYFKFSCARFSFIF